MGKATVKVGHFASKIRPKNEHSSIGTKYTLLLVNMDKVSM